MGCSHLPVLGTLTTCSEVGQQAREPYLILQGFFEHVLFLLWKVQQHWHSFYEMKGLKQSKFCCLGSKWWWWWELGLNGSISDSVPRVCSQQWAKTMQRSDSNDRFSFSLHLLLRGLARWPGHPQQLCSAEDAGMLGRFSCLDSGLSIQTTSPPRS